MAQRKPAKELHDNLPPNEKREADIITVVIWLIVVISIAILATSYSSRTGLFP